MTIKLDGNSLNLDRCREIGAGAPLELCPEALKRVESSYQAVQKIAKNGAPVYGVNTGFGYFAREAITKDKLAELQLNILRSHASGWGEPLSLEAIRLALALRLNVLLKGCTGVSRALCEKLALLANRGIYPFIPRLGSVGASGDLAPLAHLALPLIGEGKVWYKGSWRVAHEALKAEGIEPHRLREKEGLGLINGTQIMLAVGGLALEKALRISTLADRTAALTYEGMNSSLTPLDPRIHEARGQKGQIFCAARILENLQGSYLHDPKRVPLRLQDPYSLRCAPQVHGASLDALDYCKGVVERELNAATDNPLVFGDEVVSGGNFHGQPLALAFDFAALAVAELTNISDRRIEVLMNSHMSELPAFLTPEPGLCSGYMAAQYLTASIVNRGKILSHPASSDSIPGNVGIEDHVSMGTNAALKFSEIVDNALAVFAVEALSACQAIDLRGVFPLGNETKILYEAVRGAVPTLKEDRIISEDIFKVVDVFKRLWFT